MRPLPGVLVRSFREPEALSRLHAEAHEIHRRTLDTRKAVASGNASLSAVCYDAAVGARPARKHAVHVLAVCTRLRALHPLSRVRKRVLFHPPAVASTDPSVAAESSGFEIPHVVGLT